MADRIRLLLVEDSDDDARLIRRELERGGYELTWKRVESEPAFLDALAEAWDLIVSDFQMPRFNGLRAFKVYQESGIDTPFIFVSGALGEDRAVEAMRSGARDYLLKDNLARLTVAVRRELAAASNRRAQRNAEEVARRGQRRLGMALEASGAGIFEYRIPIGAETHYDERWVRLLGYAPGDVPPPELLGGWLIERIEPDDQQLAREMYDRFISGHAERLDIEFRVRHMEGHSVHVSISAHAIEREPAGRATHVVGVMLDVTERRRLEAQFRQSQKMEAIGLLAGGVAHDVNNLLSVIVVAGQFALEAIDEDHPAREDVQEVLGAAARVSALTEQLLAFSRSKPVVPRVLNVNAIVADLDRLLGRLVGTDVEMSTRLADGLWNVRIDAGSVEQVITNLAINARDSMPAGGKLTISTANLHVMAGDSVDAEIEVPQGDYVVIRVADQGVGIDERTRRRMFEPFFTTKGPGKGTGLGLATCYGIVKQAGGYIGVDSELGRGTTFSLYLPAVADVPDAPVRHEPRARQSLRGSETILVVEDDELVRRTVIRVLATLGYRVIATESGAGAVEAFEKAAAIDLLLTDMMLPDMNGSSLIERLRSLHPDFKVLRMSGPLLPKPFTAEQLARSVREALEPLKVDAAS